MLDEPKSDVSSKKNNTSFCLIFNTKQVFEKTKDKKHEIWL